MSQHSNVLALVPDERPPNENFEADEAAGVVLLLLLALVLLPNAKPLLALLPAVALVVAAPTHTYTHTHNEYQ